MVKNAYARTWTLDSIDRNQEYILYFDAVRKRWELRTLQSGEYVQTRAMERRPGRRAERPQRAKPGSGLREDPRSTMVPLASILIDSPDQLPLVINGDHRQQPAGSPREERSKTLPAAS